MQIPQVDLSIQFQSLRGELMPVIEDVLASGQLFLGPHTRAFEEEFAQYCGTRYAVCLANGTDALHLALRAAGVCANDEVITVSHTFIATIEAIHQVGARPVLVDIDPGTYTMAVDALEASLTPRTRAIIPVHLYGRVADMDPILELAKRRGLLVIEDASQAQGATNALGRKAGSLGDLGTFSFYYSKNLGAYGEAGCVTTSDPQLDRQLRLLRSHGEGTRYQHEVLGYNSRPDELQSAVLRVKLRHLDAWNGLRQQHAATYHRLLADMPVGLPELITNGSHVYHQYVVRVSDRDRVRAELTSRGVGTGVHYPTPVHLQQACGFLGYKPGDLPHTERAAGEILSMPLYPELSDIQLEYVATELRAAVGAGPPSVGYARGSSLGEEGA